MCPIAVNTHREPLFTLETDDEAVQITPYGIEVRVAGDKFGLVGSAIKILPDILDREERRKAYETNHIEAARATLMQALTFGSDEDREHAEDAVQNLVAFIGGRDETVEPDAVDTGTAETITADNRDPVEMAMRRVWGDRRQETEAGRAAWAAYDALVDRPIATGTPQTITIRDIDPRIAREIANEANVQPISGVSFVTNPIPQILLSEIDKRGFATVTVSRLHGGGLQWTMK